MAESGEAAPGAAETGSQDLSQADIDSLGSKLATWAETMSGTQRSIAQLLVEHARELTPGSLAVDRVAVDLGAATRSVMRDLNFLRTPVAWARADPVWNQANPRQGGEYDYYGDEYKLIQQVIVTVKR